jgi:hypothetical protein
MASETMRLRVSILADVLQSCYQKNMPIAELVDASDPIGCTPYQRRNHMNIVPNFNMQALEQQLKSLEDAQVKVGQMKQLIAEGAAQNEAKNAPRSEEIQSAVWSRKRQKSHASNITTKGIEITNSHRFQGLESKVQTALELIESHDSDGYQLVQKNVKSISSASRSGAAYWADRIDIGQQTLNDEPEWLAGMLVHEARHIERRVAEGGGHVDNSQEEELDCIRHQRRTLTRINAPHWMIAGLDEQDGNHYKQEITW